MGSTALTETRARAARPFSAADWAAAVVLIVAALLLYLRTIRFGYVYYDDPYYILWNNRVQNGLSLANLAWAFRTLELSNWHPLTWLSYMADVQFFGVHSAAFHLTNSLLHVANACLLFLVLRSLTGSTWRSALVAALFAIHPLHVESVAWISERKDVLSTLFAFISMLAYSRYARDASMWAYFAMIVAFMLSLHRDIHRTAFRRRGPHAGDDAACPQALQRLRGLCAVHRRYVLADAIGGLVSVPARPAIGLALLSGATLCAVTLGVMWLARTRACRPLLVGWLWYLGTLVPVIGIVSVGEQARADRYTYFPLIGLFIMIAWGVPQQCSARSRLCHGSRSACGETAQRCLTTPWRQTVRTRRPISTMPRRW